MQRIEPQAKIGEPRRGPVPPPRHAFVLFDRAIQAVLNALRRDRRGRIDAQPAASIDPNLVPGMRIALAQYPVVGVAIKSTALIAGDDAGGYARGAREDREGRGIVAAKAALRIEEKLIDGVLPQFRRRQRVEEILPSKQVEHRRDI